MPLYMFLFEEPLRGIFIVVLSAIVFHLVLKWKGLKKLREYEELTGSALSVTDKHSNAKDVAVAEEGFEQTKSDLLEKYDEILKEAEVVNSQIDDLDRKRYRLRKLAKSLKVPLKQA